MSRSVRQKVVSKYKTLDELVFAGLMDTELDPDGLPDVVSKSIYCQTAILSTDVRQDVWTAGGTKVDLNTVGETIEAVSSSVNDTLLGTGCGRIFIHGLGTDGLPLSEAIDLNGTTPVTTTGAYTFVDASNITTCSSTGDANDGSITLTGSDSSEVQGVLEAGRGIMYNSHYKIPVGYNALFIGIFAGVESSSGGGDKAVKTIINTRLPNGLKLETVEWEQKNDGSGTQVFDLKVPFHIPSTSIFWLSAVSSTNTTKSQYQLEFVLVRDTININSVF